MFSILKNRIKGVLSSFSKKVKDEVEDIGTLKSEKIKVKKQAKSDKTQIRQQRKDSKKKVRDLDTSNESELLISDKGAVEKKHEKKKGFFGKLFKKKSEVGDKVVVQEDVEKSEEISEEKKGFFGKLRETISTKTLSNDKFNELFGELEIALFENNVAVEVVERIKDDLRAKLVEQYIKRSEIDTIVLESLKQSINSILLDSSLDLLSEIRKKKPYVICFLGINGSGKSTTIAKVANLLQKNNLSCVIAASDTFRAAAIEQLGEWAKKLDIKMISHEYGADPAAVSFDAVKYAESHRINVVLIDTAGRLHSNKNLMFELQKIIRVAKPDLKLFVGESITGNDCIEQAAEFDKFVSIDGIILSKVDVDEKGGTAVSISYVVKKPILYVGTGQTLDDIERFDRHKIMKNLGL
jgi:fused signal recognition particle receptor